MPKAFPGLKAFNVWTKVSWSYWALRATVWIQNKIRPQHSFKTNLFSHITWKKKKITRKNTPVGYFECFNFYPQLRFLFQDSSAKQDGLPNRAWLLWRRIWMLKCHGVCQGDTGAGALLFWGTCSGISEYWQYFRLQAFKGAYLSAPSA